MFVLKLNEQVKEGRSRHLEAPQHGIIADDVKFHVVDQAARRKEVLL
jgi:hypothetical protein